MFARSISLASGSLVLILGVAVAVSAQTSGVGMPDLTGTWVGEATYAGVDGTVMTSSERFAVTKQDGPLLWGTFEYQATGEDAIVDGVTGTILGDGTSLVLTEPGTLLQGSVADDTMTLVAAWLGAEDHGAFQMTLTRE